MCGRMLQSVEICIMCVSIEKVQARKHHKPQQAWCVERMHDSAGSARCMQAHMHAGSQAEEATRTEQTLDMARSKVETLAGKVAAREQRWVGAGVPWERDAVKRARFAALHLAQSFMAGYASNSPRRHPLYCSGTGHVRRIKQVESGELRGRSDLVTMMSMAHVGMPEKHS